MLTWHARADAFVQRVEVVADVTRDVTTAGRVDAAAGCAHVKKPASTIRHVAL